MDIRRAVKGFQPLPRRLTATLTAALRTLPIAVVTGARQTGKSTPVRNLINGGARRNGEAFVPPTQAGVGPLASRTSARRTGKAPPTSVCVK
jgi:hypothetical protein